MSNLVVVIISIALIASAILVGTYYGSTIWIKGDVKAKAVTYINQAEQIKMASRAYKSSKWGRKVSNLQDLVDDKFLNTMPEVADQIWQAELGKIYISVTQDNRFEGIEICNEIMKNRTGEEDYYYYNSSSDTNLPCCADNPNEKYFCCEKNGSSLQCP